MTTFTIQVRLNAVSNTVSSPIISFLKVKPQILDIYLKIFIGYGKSIDKLGFDILDNLANLPPLSVLGFLLMAISVGGIALQLSTFIADGKNLGTHLEVLVS